MILLNSVEEKKYIVSLTASLSGVFILCPMAGILITLIFAWFFNTWRFAKFVTLVVVLFLWCIESTRTFTYYEEGDFPGYMNMFLDVGKVSLLKLIISPSSAKLDDSIEYGWMVLNRFGYALFNGNFFHFVYCLIASSYLLIFIALYKYYKSVKANFRCYLCSIVFLAFLSSYFSMINNILSQQIAVSLVIYSLIVKIVENRFKWYLMFFAVSLHTMTIAFLPLFLFKLNKIPSIKHLGILLVFFLCFYIVIQHFDMISLIGVSALQRFASASSYLGTDVIDSSVVLKYNAFMIVVYILVCIQKNVHPKTIELMNITMLMSLLYILMAPLPLIQTRYYITRLVFLPFVVPFVCGKNNTLGDLYTLVLMSFFILTFFSFDFYNFNFTIDTLLDKSFFDFNIL